MWWQKSKQPEQSLRAQLVEACDKVRRQIQVMESTPNYRAIGSNDPTSGKQTALRDLQSELDQLEEALANLGSDNAQGS